MSTEKDYLPYLQKKNLTYVDLNAILNVALNLRGSSTYSVFKRDTGYVYRLFVNKLNYDQKVIFRSVITKLREHFLTTLNQCNFTWLTRSKIITLSLPSPLLSFHSRQVILRRFQPPNSLPI